MLSQIAITLGICVLSVVTLPRDAAKLNGASIYTLLLLPSSRPM